jgi:hypothetical protein
VCFQRQDLTLVIPLKVVESHRRFYNLQWDNQSILLDKILNIQPKTYEYKDVINRGTKRVARLEAIINSSLIVDGNTNNGTDA